MKSKNDTEAMANKAGLSLRQFNRRFKTATGETPTRYLQAIRVDMAKVELVNTKRAFDEISLDAGYENVSFFRKIFKTTTSLNPAEYRKRFCQI